MLATTAMAIPSRAQRDLKNCVDLFRQKNYKQSEVELKKLIRNFPELKDHLTSRCMQFFFEVVVRREHENLDKKIQYFLEAVKNDTMDNEDKLFIPFILTSAFAEIGRPDKSAEIVKIYLDRHCNDPGMTKCLRKNYFDSMIQQHDFDEQAKTALKMFQNDKSEINKYQVCVAILLQAISQPEKKGREMGFDFVLKLAEKILAVDNPGYLETYQKVIQQAKITYAEKPFLSPSNIIPALMELQLLSLESSNDEATQTSSKELTSYTVDSKMEEKNQIFKARIEALKEGPRSFELWYNAFNTMVDLKLSDPKSDVYSVFATLLQELEAQNPLEIADLIICIKFLRSVKAENYQLGTIAERMDEYIERFGHECHANEVILKPFSILSAEDKKNIIDKNKKLLDLLKSYLDKTFRIGVNTEVIDARTDIIDEKDIEAFGKAAVPDNKYNLVSYYYHRLYITDIMELSSNPGQSHDFFEEFISKWIKNIDYLDSDNCAGLAEKNRCQAFIRRVNEMCITSLFELFKKNDNDMYFEMLTCLLQRFAERTAFFYTDLIKKYEMCQDYLGFCSYSLLVVINNSEEIDTNTFKNYLFENCGHFSSAYNFYQRLLVQKREYLKKSEADLKMCYEKGEIENVCGLYESVNHQLNSIFAARCFSRHEFLASIFLPTPSFSDAFFKDAWSNELPMGLGFMEEKEYCSAINEVKIIRILCHFLIAFNDYKSPASFNLSLQNSLNYYLSIIPGKILYEDEEPNQTIITELNIFENAVIQPFMKLINVYVKSLVAVLSKPGLSVDSTLQKLPNISKFRACVDEVSTILYGLFGQKFKNAHRIRACADTVKMANYMARLIATTYQALGKYLNVEIEDFEKIAEYQGIYIQFRQYSVELKLLMDVIISLAQKWLNHLLKNVSSFVNEPDTPATHYTVLAVREYVQKQYVEYKLSFQNIIQTFNLSPLIEIGLLKPNEA